MHGVIHRIRLNMGVLFLAVCLANAGKSSEAIQLPTIDYSASRERTNFVDHGSANRFLRAIYVFADGSGYYETIQEAIDSLTSGDTIFLNQGVYTGPGNRDIELAGKSISLIGVSGATNTILDCQGSQFDNHRALSIHDVPADDFSIQGITFRNGYLRSGLSDQGGAAVACRSASPTIAFCEFRNNVVEGAIEEGGGAILLENSSALISHCLFVGNRTPHSLGGAVTAHNSSPGIENCTFVDNMAWYGDALGIWGGSANVSIVRSLFAFNGQAGWSQQSAIFCMYSPSPYLSCCDVIGNANGDWSGCIADQAATNNNFSLDPAFCDQAGGNYFLKGTSPCANYNSPCTAQVGAFGVACDWILNDPGVPDTIIVGCPVYFPSIVHPPLVDSVGIPLYISCDEPVFGFSLGFEYTGDSVEITSWSAVGSVIPSQPYWLQLMSAKPDQNQILIGAVDFTAQDPIPVGRGLLGTLYMRLLGGDPFQIIDLDSTFVSPAGRWQMNADTSFAPGYQRGPLSPQYRDCGTDDIFVGQSDGTAWNFGNSEANMWPQSWWQQFNYCYPNSPCNLYCLLCPASGFPNWDLFASAIGDSQAYFPGTGTYRPSALAQWEALRGDWTGSCFGFAAGSDLFEDEFLDVTTEFPGYTELSNVPVMAESRELINKYYLYQFGYNQQQLINDAVNTVTPSQTLSACQNMLSQTPRNDRVLMLFSQSSTGGHAVAPYRCIQDGGDPDLWYIYAYDSNFPQDTTKRIEINTLTNTWSYLGQPEWGGSHGLFLLDSVSNYLSPLILTDTTAANENIRFYFGEADSASFSSPQGTMGFGQNGTYGAVTGGSPIIPADGKETPPIGYFLPTGEWYCLASGVVDGIFTVVDGHKRIFRNGGAKSGIISAQFSPGILMTSLTTYGTGEKNGRGIYDTSFMEVISITPDSEIVVQLSGLELPSGDSVTLSLNSDQKVQFDNYGDETTYDLMIKIVSATEDTIFYHEEISIGSSTSHLISPDWRPTGDSVLIAVDTSMTGDFSDSTMAIPNGQLAPFLCGDCDNNKRVDITDAVYLVNYIFSGGPAPSPLQIGDTDRNGRVDVTDAVYLVNYIFAGGPAPCATCK